MHTSSPTQPVYTHPSDSHHQTLGTTRPLPNEFAEDMRDVSFPPIAGSLKLHSESMRRYFKHTESPHDAPHSPENSVRHSSIRSYGSVNVSNNFSKVSPSEELSEENDLLISEYVTVDTPPDAIPPMVSYVKLTKFFKSIVTPSTYNKFSVLPQSGFIPDVKDFYDPKAEAEYLSGQRIKLDEKEISKVALYYLAQFDREKFPFSQHYEKVFASAIQMNQRTAREMGIGIQCVLYSAFGACSAAGPLLSLSHLGSMSIMGLSSALSFSTVFLPALVSWRISGANPHASSVINNLKQDIEQRLKDDYILYSVTLIRLHHGSEKEMQFAREVASKCNIDLIEKLLDDVGVPNASIVVSSLREAIDYVLEGKSPPFSVPLQQEVKLVDLELQIKALQETKGVDRSRIHIVNEELVS